MSAGSDQSIVVANGQEASGSAAGTAVGSASFQIKSRNRELSPVILGPGGPRRLDRLRTLGNAVVPQCAQIIAELIAELCRNERRWLQAGEAGGPPPSIPPETSPSVASLRSGR
jgi:hypothetical protein